MFLKKRFARVPVYNKKYSKTKILSYKGRINTNFHHNRMPKEGSYCLCLLVILIDSVQKE